MVQEFIVSLAKWAWATYLHVMGKELGVGLAIFTVILGLAIVKAYEDIKKDGWR